MSLAFAAVVYRTSEIDDRALTRGFAVALAGWDIAAPSLLVAELPQFPGYSVAFYRSGVKAGRGHVELEHAAEVFRDELPPGLAVRDEVGGEVVVRSLVYSDAVVLDDAARFDAQGFERRWVGDGDEGLEAGRANSEGEEVEELEDDDEAVVGPHRGSAFLAAELGGALVPALAAALFQAERRLPIALCAAGPRGVEEELDALVRTLRRVRGRGAPSLPEAIGGVRVPDVVRAFASAYDWADPADPADLYRELAIGAIVGTLHFARHDALEGLVAQVASRGAVDPAGAIFPFATLRPSALGGSGRAPSIVATSADGERLYVVESGRAVRLAGPTFAELVAYLALGFRARDAIEEDRIGALMLRAHHRASASPG
jgi:hypothetical protein